MAKLKESKNRFSLKRQNWFWIALIITVVAGAWVYKESRPNSKVGALLPAIPHIVHKPVGGKVITQEVLRNYSAQEVNALAKQNYGGNALPAKSAISKRLVKYTSIDLNGNQIEEYARIYMPRTNDNAKYPLLVLAPGTTGIGDECAASLEDPAKANWANYESHAAAYAGQGYAVVIPDYEGMRDPTRIHHYMVGDLEGRAVLDAVRATYNLNDVSSSINRNQLFLAGYSQGGHAVAWADQIQSTYAPELKISGVIGFAPVSNVETTLNDVARGADIVWFGPYLLVSYSDYYQQNFDTSAILQPKFSVNLKNDVLSHCINSVKYWDKAADVYTPTFLNALKTNTLAAVQPALAADLVENQAWTKPSTTPKLINQGDKDTIIMPDQQTKALPLICAKGSGPAQLQTYADTTHYNLMVKSYKDVLAWMTKVATSQTLPTSCGGSQ